MSIRPPVLSPAVAGGTYAQLTQVPTLEELDKPFTLPASITAATTVYLGPMNLDKRIGALALSFSAAVAASDTNYWTIALVRYRAGGTPVTLAQKTTKATGGVAIAANTGWNFDNVDWPSVLRYVLKDDVLALVFTPTGAPTALSGAAGALREEPSLRVPVRDTFTRANSTTSLGAADTGQAWSVLPTSDGTPSIFGINSSQGALHQSSTSRNYAVVDPGVADVSVSAVILNPATAGIGVRLIAHGGGTTDGYIHNGNTLFRADAGVLVSLGTFASSLVAGDTMTMTCSGSTITVYRNGVNVLSVTDATYTSTKHGLRASAPTLDTGLWDDFALSAA